eukprot:SAG31_NODE_22496_length_524_cov_1.058824_1_plen_115_part_00
MPELWRSVGLLLPRGSRTPNLHTTRGKLDLWASRELLPLPAGAVVACQQQQQKSPFTQRFQNQRKTGMPSACSASTQATSQAAFQKWSESPPSAPLATSPPNGSTGAGIRGPAD